MDRPSRAATGSRRRRVGRALALSAALALGAALGLSLYVQRPSFRAALLRSVEKRLDGSVRGRIELDGLTQLGLSGARLERLQLRDERGVLVLTLDGVALRFSLLGLLGPWLPGAAPLELAHVRVERSRVLLVSDPTSGQPSLLRALEPRPGGPRAEPRAPGAALVVSLPEIELGQVLVEHADPALAALALRIQRVHGRATLGGEHATLEVQRFGLSLSAGEQRWVNGTGSLALASEGPLVVSFHGFVRGTELDARVELAGGELTGRLDVPHATPHALRRLWPGWPLRAPLALELRARGPLDALLVEGEAALEEARVALRGTLRASGSPRAELELHARGLDARALFEGAPRTSLEARGTLALSGGADGLLAQAALRTERGRVGAFELPPVELALQSAGGATSVRAELGDARGRVELSAELARDGSAELTASARRLSLAALAGGGARGELTLAARGRVVEGVLRGSVSGRGDGLALGPLTLDAGTLTGSFAGELAALEESELELTIAADGVALGPARLARARVVARGSWDDSRVQAELEQAGVRGNASGRLRLRRGARLEGLALQLDGGGVSLSAAASVWDLDRGRLSVERLSLDGVAGALQATLRRAPGQLSLRAEAAALDTTRLWRALGVSGVPVGGVWTGAAALDTGSGEVHGELHLEAKDARFRELGVAQLAVRGSLEDRRVELALEGADPNLGQLRLRADGELGGAPLELASWRRAQGTASAALERLPLWLLGALLPSDGPLRELDGRVGVSVTLERSDPSRPPDVFLVASTEGLTFALAPELGVGSAAFQGYALQASANLDGGSGRGQASVRVTDAHGALATASGVLTLDPAALSTAPLVSLEALRTAPLDALLRIHPRLVSQLPPPLAARDLAGSVEATLQLGGSLSEPSLSLAARARGLLGSVSNAARAVDVSGRLEYAPRTGRVHGTADVLQAGKGLVLARVEGHLPPLLTLPARADEIELRAAAMLNGVPLELWPAAARERLEASLYGSVELQRERGGATRERAHVEIAGLSAQGQPLGNGRLTLDRGRDGLRAELRLGDREHYLRASLRGGDAGDPERVRGSVVAREFDAASLAPLTSGLLSRLGGAMNAELEFSLKPKGPSDWYLGIDGEAKLRGGVAHIEELGLEVREIDADVRARSTAEHTILQIRPLSARARSRAANIHGDAELWLRGLRVESGEANLTLSDVPLSLKGVSRGIARGEVQARLERLPEGLLLQVKIPTLRVRLPPSSTRALIALDENADLRVLQASAPAEERDPEALRWTIRLDLGRNVRVQRGDLDVPLTGHPVLEFQHEVRPSGNIEATPGGHVTLFNQSFSIDRGLIQLDPDAPDNPRVDVTASWRAPDGTTIYVDVTGRAQDATVLTRDDRGLQDVERFYLITGGALASGGQPTDSSAAEAAAIGQTFTLGINEVLRNALGNVALSIGATPDDRASYSASVRLTDKLTFQGSFLPASESNLEAATNDLTGTLDYRFSRRWSLRTELGTSGGAFDLLWSHRY